MASYSSPRSPRAAEAGPLSNAIGTAVNIALARQVYDIPEQPIVHAPIAEASTNFPRPHSEYSLPPQKELELSHALAVVSKFRDESDYTSAVAVVEDPEQSRLQVLLAVNRATPEDGLDQLEMTKTAVESVLSLMSQVRDSRNEGMEDKILVAIVTACEAKILARMGLAECRHNKTRKDLDFKLNQAVTAVNGMLFNRNPEGGSQFRMYGTNVIQLIAGWRRNQRHVANLVAVVKGLHDLNLAVPNLDQLMRELPPRSIVPSAAKSISAIVSKTAYYVRVARTLYRIAKKYPVARRATVVPLLMDDSVFEQTPMPRPGTVTREGRIRAMCPVAPTATIQHIMHVIDSKKKAKRAGESFEEIMQTSLTGRVHAEMQIIYHCAHPDFPAHFLPPRTVCSSKASCWLCNTFVNAHCGIYIPFSHGRLYTNWRLPNMPGIPGMDNIESAFVNRLQATVTWGLGLLSAYDETPKRPEPAQSVIMTLPRSDTTIEPEQTEEEIAAEAAQQHQCNGHYHEEEEYVDRSVHLSRSEIEDRILNHPSERAAASQAVDEEEGEEHGDIPHILPAHDDDEDDGVAVGDSHFQEGVPVTLEGYPYSCATSGQRELINESVEVETAPTTPEPEQEELVIATKPDLKRTQSEPAASMGDDEDDHAIAASVPDLSVHRVEESAPRVVSQPVEAPVKEVEAAVEAAAPVEAVAAAPIDIPQPKAFSVPMPVPTPPTSSAIPLAVQQANKAKETVSAAVDDDAVVDDEDDEEVTPVAEVKEAAAAVVAPIAAVEKVAEKAVEAPVEEAAAPVVEAAKEEVVPVVETKAAEVATVVKEAAPVAKVEEVAAAVEAAIPVTKVEEVATPAPVSVPVVEEKVAEAVPATPKIETPVVEAPAPVTPTKAVAPAPVTPTKAVAPATSTPVSPTVTSPAVTTPTKTGLLSTPRAATPVSVSPSAETPKKKSKLKSLFKVFRSKKDKK